MNTLERDSVNMNLSNEIKNSLKKLVIEESKTYLKLISELNLEESQLKCYASFFEFLATGESAKNFVDLQRVIQFANLVLEFSQMQLVTGVKNKSLEKVTDDAFELYMANVVKTIIVNSGLANM
jgi:hypothetical protein